MEVKLKQTTLKNKLQTELSSKLFYSLFNNFSFKNSVQNHETALDFHKCISALSTQDTEIR